MEGGRKLDAAGGAPISRVCLCLIIFFCPYLTCLAQDTSPSASSQPSDLSIIRKLFDEQRWSELAERAATALHGDADAGYYYGVALAQLGRWDEARAALLEARRRQPSDKRTAIELGGIAFKHQRYKEAARWVRLGLQLDPSDTYANDFLATIYYLQDNLPAALKYWNQVGKPHIGSVRVVPELRVQPAVLDRAFAFSAAGTLQLHEFVASEKRVSGLGIFPVHRFRLNARDDGAFDVAFDARERNGWGSGWRGLLAALRGIFAQTVYPEYFNIVGGATNITSLVRWDAQKRRVAGTLSSVPWQNPKYRYRVSFDARNENWELRRSFTGFAPVLGAINLRRTSVLAEIASFSSAAWTWTAGGELSFRDYRGIQAGVALPDGVMLKGYQLKQLSTLTYNWRKSPEKRFESDLTLSSQLGSIYSSPPRLFEKLEGSVAARWFPQIQGDDYATTGAVYLGRIAGTAPFDELYTLGVHRDNPLRLRAHLATRDGRKGSAPLGRAYVLINSDFDKELYRYRLVTAGLGAFVDSGKSLDPLPGLENRWMWDTGVQLKFRAFGFGVAFVYGKDLRTGNNAFYLTTF